MVVVVVWVSRGIHGWVRPDKKIPNQKTTEILSLFFFNKPIGNLY